MRPGARPTKADVARLANVSAATVSYVLNDVKGQTISAQTRADAKKADGQAVDTADGEAATKPAE